MSLIDDWYSFPMNFSRKLSPFPKFSEVVADGAGGSEVYSLFSSLFRKGAPLFIKRHRGFFQKEQRGFGEDAFHAMWFSLFLEFKPLRCLEIGVYRGQVVSLWGLLSRRLSIECEIYALSPFEPVGDTVGSYRDDVDYEADVKANLQRFNLSNVTLVKALSHSKEGQEFITASSWDLVYVDGSHEYDTVRADCTNSIKALRKGGLLVMDDAALYRPYTPFPGTFAGHPGPSEVAEELISGSIQEWQVAYLGHVGHNLIFQKR